MTFTQLISATGWAVSIWTVIATWARVRRAANDKHAHKVEPVTLSIISARGHELSNQFYRLVFEVGTHCRLFRSVDKIHGLCLDLACFVLWQIAFVCARSPGCRLGIVCRRQRRFNVGFVTGQIVDAFRYNPGW